MHTSSLRQWDEGGTAVRSSPCEAWGGLDDRHDRTKDTIRAYQGKVSECLISEFGDTSLRDINAARIKVMAV